MNTRNKKDDTMNGNAKWKGVIFDFDGTLLDSVSEGRARFLRVAASLDLPVSEEIIREVQKLWGVPGYALVHVCWPGMSAETFMHQWETFDSVHPIQLFSGAKEVIEQLSSRFQLSLITSRSWSTRYQLVHHGIDSLFSFVYTLEDCPDGLVQVDENGTQTKVVMPILGTLAQFVLYYQ